MNNFYVTLIVGTTETRVGDRNLNSKQAEVQRDRLNAGLAAQGVKYSECRYAVRLVNVRAIRRAA